jgi:hypothetical protein
VEGSGGRGAGHSRQPVSQRPVSQPPARRRRRATRMAAAAVSCLAAALPAGIAGGATATTPPAVRVGHVPRLPAGTVAISGLPSRAALRVDVTLRPRDPAGLAAYALAVSTPGSGRYRQYLDTRQFAARFGPTRRAVDSVTHALEAEGLHPGSVTPNDLSIPVRATAGQLSRAFSIGFRQYRVRSGRVAFSTTAPPRFAGSTAPFVQAVVGLDDLTVATPAARQSPAGAGSPAAGTGAGTHVATGGPQPCATAVADGVSEGSYTTDQAASAYGFSNLYGQGDLGAGQTVALYELQGFGVSDIASYQACYGTAALVTTVIVDGGPLKHSGVGEADVDIEQVSSLAPGAHIVVYEGPNDDPGEYDTYNSIISQDTARVISTSWGICEPDEGNSAAQAENSLFQEAATQGQSVFAASGDQGSEDCLGSGYAGDTLAVDDPASQPYVTGVGGTSWTASGTPPDESAWNDGPTCCWGAGGGGVSSLWAMPSYQSASVGNGVINAGSSGSPCGLGAGSFCREVPDVSALAGPYPYLEYVSGQWGSWGGTSLAAPLWASLIALADASPSCGGESIGFADPALYAAASRPGEFNDVTSGDNDLSGDNHGDFPALVGYDMTTGLGTPNGAELPAALCAGTSPSPVSVTDPGAQSSDVGVPASVAVAATDATPGQTLTYSAVGLPAGLSIAPATGLISGAPSAAGSFLVSVRATDGNGATGATSFAWSVTQAITSAGSASAEVGSPFSFTIVATGAPTAIKATGTIPKGVKFHRLTGGTATLSGTPKMNDSLGAYPLVIRATYGKGKSADVITQSFTLAVT